MPARLHVGVYPSRDAPDHPFALTLMVAGESQERALELVRNMEDSRRFRQPKILTVLNATTSYGGGQRSIRHQFAVYIGNRKQRERPLMPDLRNARRQLKVAFVALAVVNLAAIAVLLRLLRGLAAGPSTRSRCAVEGIAAKNPRRRAATRDGQDLAQQQIDTFYKEQPANAVFGNFRSADWVASRLA